MSSPTRIAMPSLPRLHQDPADAIGPATDPARTQVRALRARLKQMEHQLTHSDAFLLEHRSLLNAASGGRDVADDVPAMLWTSGSDGLRTWSNRVRLEFTGRTPGEELGHDWSQAVHPQDIGRCRETYSSALSARRTFQLEYRLRRRDGSYRWVLEFGAPRFEGNTFLGFLSTAFDVQDRKRAEELLEQTNTGLNHFASVVAHDLREPVHNIQLCAQMLERKLAEAGADGGEFPALVIDNARRLHRLIDDLLDYARAMHQGPHPGAPVDAGDVLDEVRRNLAQAIESTGARVTADLLPPVGIVRSHLLQLLQNLVGNALKYHAQEPPRIHVSAELAGHQWLFTVEDNGVGVPEESQDSIFALFHRLHGQDVPGTGLGLGICRRILELYGGKIWVEPTPGSHGSRFRFLLPAANAVNLSGRIPG